MIAAYIESHQLDAMRIAGARVRTKGSFAVFNPFTGDPIGRVPKASLDGACLPSQVEPL
jgi:hypothetical protein